MESMRQAVHKVLTDKGCSVWGRPFMIDQFDDRDKCVTWLMDTIINPVLKEMGPSDDCAMCNAR